MKKTGPLWPKLILLATGLIWGSSNVTIKGVVEQIPAAFLIALRCTIACGVLAAIFWKKVRKITGKDLIAGGIIGLCLFLAYYVQTCGMYFTNPGKSGFLASSYCVIVPFLYWIIFRKRPAIKHLVAAGLCIAGVVLCSVTEDFSVTWGDTMTLLSGFFYAAHIVAINKCGEGKDPITLTILQFGFSAVFGWIVALTTETSRICLPGEAVTSVLYLALVCTCLAMLLQNLGQRATEPNLASILMSTESVFSVLLSVLAGYDVLSGRLIAGFVLIFAAIIVSELQVGGKKSPSPERSH